MKKIIKLLFIFSIGIISGYYICSNNIFKDFFNIKFKAFQIGVYIDEGAANTFAKRYNNAIVVKDNELYRVYISILKDKNNIEYMSNYLNKNNIAYFLKDVEINNYELKKEISNYENIMENNNELVFLEMNKLITKLYKESI